jgi:hypothetical protein
MVNPLIRLAEVRDARALAELWLEIGKHLAALNLHAFKLPEAAGLAEWFAGSLTTASNEDSATFVAEIGPEVAGTIYVRLIPPMEIESRQVLRDVGPTPGRN